MNELELALPAKPPRVGIVAARFNHFVTSQLLDGALDALRRNGLDDEHLAVCWVPGAFELPLAADRLLASGTVDGVIALGAVIRGATPHFDYVAGECSRGLMDVALRRGQAVIFGVLTTDSVEQALERAGAGEGNKGYDAALACLHMISLLRALQRHSSDHAG